MENSDNLKLDAYVEELYAALDGKADKETLRKELVRYIVEYKIDATTAKDSIMKRYNQPPRTSGTFVSGASVTKKINELEGTEMNVTVVAKMVYVERKEITTKNGAKTIISGIIGDDTATAPFTIWSDSGDYEKGAVYTFKNAYCKKFKDQVQINLGLRGKVEPAEGVTFQTPEGGSFSSASSAATDMAIGDITDQTKSLNVVGVISNVQSRNILVKGEEKTVWGGIIADSTGKVQFSAWSDFQLKDGETLSIKNAYIRAWKGIPQLNFGERSTVTRTAEQITAVNTGTVTKTVEEVMKVGGGLDLNIVGTIVDVRTGSGLITRCPQCNRSILNNVCSIHGQVEPKLDLRLKLTIDDGTGATSAIINCADTEKITGMTLDQAVQLSKEKGNADIVANTMARAIILKKASLNGNIMSDEFGPQMSVHSIELVNTNVAEEAEKLYREVEGSL